MRSKSHRYGIKLQQPIICVMFIFIFKLKGEMKGNKHGLWKKMKTYPPLANGQPLKYKNTASQQYPIFHNFLSSVHQNDFLAHELIESEFQSSVYPSSSVSPTSFDSSSFTNPFLLQGANLISYQTASLDALREQFFKFQQSQQVDTLNRIDKLLQTVVDITKKKQQKDKLQHYSKMQSILISIFEERNSKNRATELIQKQVLSRRIKQLQFRVKALYLEKKQLQFQVHTISEKLEQMQKQKSQEILMHKRNRILQPQRHKQTSSTKRTFKKINLSPRSTETKRFMRTNKPKFQNYLYAKTPKSEINTFHTESRDSYVNKQSIKQ